MTRALVGLICSALLAAACSGEPAAPTYGANPQLPTPNAGVLPTINVAKAVGWPDGASPAAPSGMTVTRFAEGLAHPRWIHVLPNGDILVAEASTHPAAGNGVETMIANAMQKRGGAFGDGGDRITLLRDSDHDGVADIKNTFISLLNQPMGMALVGDTLYVANTDALLKFPYVRDATTLSAPGEKVLDLPYRAGDNGHWTRTLLASPDGAKLYVAVGSSSNIADHGLAAEAGRAAVWEVDLATGNHRIFASGIRNPVGIDWEPGARALWVAVNERDMLGDNLVPDYMTHVQEGAFYGWPYSYWGAHVDARVTPQNAALVASAVAPDYALGAHTASLGLHFYTGALLPEKYRGGAFVGQHGSWNRSRPSGYKVVFVPFANGAPSGAAEDFLTGFLNARSEAQGRPVGVATDQTGALLVADDVGEIIWRVAPAAP